MSKSFETIDSALGLLPQEESKSTGKMVVIESTEVIVDVGDDSAQDQKDDYNFVRTKMRDIIEKAADGFENILTLAEDAESPRAYEVAANFAKTIADVSKNLMDLHKDTTKQIQPDAPSTVNHTTQNIFTGTTAELLTLLKQQHALPNGS